MQGICLIWSQMWSSTPSLYLVSGLARTWRRKIDDHREMMVADMTVAYKVFKETFASRVTLDRQASKITVEYLDGPFRHLENVWSFDALSEGECDVSFYINYEFRSRALVP